MVYVGSTGRRTHVERSIQHGYGRLVLPGYWKNPIPGLRWCLDNGAYGAWSRGEEFDAKAFMAVCGKVPPDAPPDFVVVPDLVARGLDSLTFSLRWCEYLEHIHPSWPRYLAVQDGMTRDDLEPHLARFQGLFVGGTLKWKHHTAEQWVQLAHANGLKCHIGRVPTLKRLLWAERIGADSVDSTTWARNDRFEVLDEWRERRQSSIFLYVDGDITNQPRRDP